jgi:Transposase and inactivated derivatives
MHATTTLPQISSLEQARGVVTSLFNELQQARWRIAQLEKQVFGPSSERKLEERLSKEQTLFALFPEPAQPAATQEVLLAPTEEKVQPRPRRQPAAKVLETVTERIEPQEKVCAHCGKEKCEIGHEKSERYEYVPAKVVRHEIIRPKLACMCGQAGVSIAPLPPSVVAQGQPGASLVAHVLLSKYVDHLPLYRQQQQFERLGINFPKSTLGDWVEQGAAWLQAIVREMKQQLLQGDYVQVDETPVRVQDPDVKGKCATGWLWVVGTPGGDVVFEFHPGRGKEFARQLLGDFKGRLQRDGYGVYGALAKDNPTLEPVGCWSHVRRKFVDALEYQREQATVIVDELRKLYLVERHARAEGLTPEQRSCLRQQLSLPILTGLKPLLQSVQEKVLPESPLGKATRYCLAEWEPLTRYLSDGRLEIDNNLTENAIRPSAVGKKNWLFIGHPEAGWRSAVIYSIVVSCQRRGIEPWQYLSDVLRRLPAMQQSELPSLLPANWKPA